MYIRVFCLDVYMCTVCMPGAHKGQKCVSDTLETEKWMQTILCSARVANTLNHGAMTPAPIPHISYNELKPLQRVQVFFKIISDVCAVSIFHKGKLSSERNNALCMSVLLMEEHKEISLLNPHSMS